MKWKAVVDNRGKASPNAIKSECGRFYIAEGSGRYAVWDAKLGKGEYGQEQVAYVGDTAQQAKDWCERQHGQRQRESHQAAALANADWFC